MAEEDTTHVPAQLTHRLAHLNPFRSKGDEGGEEKGELVTGDSIAGGGRRAEDRSGLHVSHAIRAFLAEKGEIGESDIGGTENDAHLSEGVVKVLNRLPVNVPEYVMDRNHSLSEYYISSSHNTYLTADQLVGKASSMGYTHTLLSGARCVEMDCWNNEKDPAEPKVTHGMTLTTHIPFRAVVKVVREAIDKEVADAEKHGDAPPPPVMISLENHCTPDVQKRLVEIMREEWGDRLVSNLVEDAEDIKLSQLSGKIVCMIEYYGGQSEEEVKAETAEALEVNDSDDEDTRKMKEKKSKAKGKIIPELTALGIYAASVKPTSNNWLEGTMTEPKNHLINVGEGACEKYLEKNRDALVKHNAQHLMRVYPAGMRVTSKNLYPVNFWDGGAQVCALNWQTFDASMQLNDAMFAGTYGWALKPPQLRRSLAPPEKGKTRLTVEVVGATDLPLPVGHNPDDIRPYVTISLYHPDFDSKPSKQKTSAYKQHHMKIIHRGEQPPPIHPFWKETLEWDPYPKNELVFMRMLVKSDDKFAKNPVFAVTSMRIAYKPDGYVFLRLLDLKGRETKSTLLVKITTEDA